MRVNDREKLLLIIHYFRNEGLSYQMSANILKRSITKQLEKAEKAIHEWKWEEC